MYEVDDLIFDPVIHAIIVGLLDGAFRAKYASIQDIFKLRADSHRRSMQLH
jgi:hypothetical protein